MRFKFIDTFLNHFEKFILLLLFTTLAYGCSGKPGSLPANDKKTNTAATDSLPKTHSDSASETRSPQKDHADTDSTRNVMHDPAHPPIDCPFRKLGIDATHMRPFEDVEKYISFLEREDRAIWQKPDAVVSALGLNGTETVMDLGAGSGYFTFRLAKALSFGRVIAADIEPEMIRHIHHKAMTEGIKNIEPKLIQPDNPAVPAGVDLIFVCDVLHHVSQRSRWLHKITSAMSGGARLVLVEFKEGDLPQGPPENMKITRKQMIQLVTNAGLKLKSDNEKLLPYQTFMVFEKP